MKTAKPTRRMRVADLFGMATTSLVSNKLRTGLTIFGIVIGVWVVVTVMTALSAVHQSINSGLALLGSNTFEIGKMPRVTMGGDGWWNYRRRPNIDIDMATRFEDMMAQHDVLVTASGSRDGYRASRLGHQMPERISLVGASRNYLTTNNREVAVGRFFNQDDIEMHNDVAVIGETIRKELFPTDDPLGKRVVLGGHTYTVIGILEKKGLVFGQDADALAIVPLTVFVEYHWSHHRTLRLAVQAPDAQSVEATKDLAIGTFRVVRHLEPEQKNDFELYTNESLRAVFDQISTAVGGAALIISAISLVTAGVGVMNIMLVSVSERTREIGVRKSIGARAKDIMRQFLIEAIFIAQIGALLGVAIGVLCGNVAAHFLNVQPIMPWFWIGVAVTTCAGIGLGFGLYPAWRAAHLDPVEALRYE